MDFQEQTKQYLEELERISHLSGSGGCPGCGITVEAFKKLKTDLLLEVERRMPKEEDIKLVHQVFQKMENPSAAYDYAGGQTFGYNRCLKEIREILNDLKQ